MRLKNVRLVNPVQSPEFAPGSDHSGRDIFTASDTLELEAIDHVLFIRGPHGVVVTPWANVRQGQVEAGEAELFIVRDVKATTATTTKARAK